MSELNQTEITHAPIFHSMFCRDCDKKMQGGFLQEDESFLCAKCVIRKVAYESTMMAVQKCLDILDEQLTIGNRPKKTPLRTAKGWLKAALERTP